MNQLRQVVPSAMMSIMAAISFNAAHAASGDMPMSVSNSTPTSLTVPSVPVAADTAVPVTPSTPVAPTVPTMSVHADPTDSNTYQHTLNHKNQHHGQMKRHGRPEHLKQLTPEQRAAKQAERQQKMQQRRAHRAALNQACIGHDNQRIHAKVNDTIIPGKCKTVFRHSPKSHNDATRAPHAG